MQNLFGQMVRILIAVNLFLAALLHAQPLRASEKPVHLVVLGDSLTAGFRLRPGDAFPVQLGRKLKTAGINVEVANAGVSGDTTAAGLARLDWAVPEGTDAVIVELGANDALRGLDPKQARRNLAAIVTRLKARGIEVLLAGMLAPANFGEAYAKAFDAIFAELAGQQGVLLYPFFLQGVAMRGGLNLDDGMHPNAKGVAVIVDGIMPKVKELIARVEARRAQGPPRG